MSSSPQSASYKKGDILEVYFPFRENPRRKKRRPAVVVGKTKDGYMMHMITSTIRGGKYAAREVKLDTNGTNKLSHASVIRLDRLNEIPQGDIIKTKGGRLAGSELKTMERAKKRYRRLARDGRAPKTDIAVQQAKAQAKAEASKTSRGSPSGTAKQSANMRKTSGTMGA